MKGQLHSTVLDALDVGVLTLGASGEVTYANRAALEMLGCTRVGEIDVRQALSLEDDPLALDAQTFICSVDGRDLKVTVSPRSDTSDGRVVVVIVLEDGSSLGGVEHQSCREERLTAMGIMMAGFAHEVRNPIASLRTMAESLDEELTEAGLHYPHVTRMLQVLSRVERLVNTSIQFGRPAHARAAPHRPWTLISTALVTVSSRVPGGTSVVRVEVEPDLPNVHVDDGQLVQVLVILLNNALDAVGNARQVTIRAVTGYLRRDDRLRGRSQPPPLPAVRFEVVDDGPGVPPHVERRIFDPFFTTKASGMGLGLAIAQQLVHGNGARMELASARQPTIFAVDCPTVPEAAARGGRAEANGAGPGASGGSP